MDSKKLAKIIKIIVERELKKQLPKLIKEGVAKVLTENQKVISKSKKPKEIISTKMEITEEVDAFTLANNILDDVQNSNDVVSTVGKRQLSKNPILNEILNNTKPFTDRGVPAAYTQIQSLDESFKDMDKTVSFESDSSQVGMDAIKTQMAAKMGYRLPDQETKKEGLGITTGLSGLDRILNRDNSELVKKFKTR